jgi:hypothetical protein
MRLAEGGSPEQATQIQHGSASKGTNRRANACPEPVEELMAGHRKMRDENLPSLGSSGYGWQALTESQ